MQVKIIDNYDALVAICQQFEQADFLAIDTEFVRTRTLYPKLGLVQISDGHDIALIDPVAIEDLSLVWQLLSNKKLLKVLHACSEDLEVFLHHGKVKPQNLIDSQIMMAFLGHGISIGYAAMVKHFLNIEIDKSESRTDWTKRPLSAKQLTYAAADVEYLYQLFPTLLKQVEDKGWLHAVEQECTNLINRKFTPVDESTLYQSVKFSSKLNPPQLNRLKFLAAWRYQQAKNKDLPLGFIVKDHTLIAVAQHNPKQVSNMVSLEGVETQDIRFRGKAMLHVLEKANQQPVEQYPQQTIRLDLQPGYKQIYKKLKDFLVKICNEADLNIENFASKKQINQYLTWHYQTDVNDEFTQRVDLLNGWRAELLAGRLTKFTENDFS